MFSPKRILVPTDFSPPANHALRQALDVKTQYHARMFLLHVIEEKILQCIADFCLSDDVVKQIERNSRELGMNKLRSEVGGISANALDLDISYDVRRGVAHEEILKEQEERSIDLIVIASNGRTGSENGLMGGVAEKVVRAAKCPVLVTKSRA